MYLSRSDMARENAELVAGLTEERRLADQRAETVQQLRDAWDDLCYDTQSCDHRQLVAECLWCEVERLIQVLES